MSMLFYTSLALCLLYLVIQSLYMVLLVAKKKQVFKPLASYPSISILVAARNEAENILRCLDSLNSLDYEEGKIEILVGNDQSTDYTQMIAENYIRDKAKFRLINLTGKEYPSTRGKARVLAVLAAEAKGEYLLVTDADITVNPMWAKALASQMVNNNTTMAGGTTNIKASSLFQQYQQVDWLYFMGILNCFAAIGRPMTVVGNNMAFSRKAYEETGGYGNIPFSITEDYALFKALRKSGHRITQTMNAETMVYSQPIETIRGVLKQRKRWLVGGWDLPLYYRLMIFVFGAWYFALPVMFFLNWKLALLMMLVKDFVQLAQILIINRHLRLKVEHPVAVMLYDLYLLVMIPLTSIYFFIPGKTVWKGRKY